MFMIPLNYGDAQYYMDTMKKYKCSKMIDFRPFKEIEELIAEYSAMISTFHETINNLSNYKGRFEIMLGPAYQEAYNWSLNSIMNHLSTLNSAKDGKAIKKFVDLKRQKLENISTFIETAAKRVRENIWVLSNKAIEFEKDLKGMESAYNEMVGDSKRKKIREYFKNFRKNMKELLETVKYYDIQTTFKVICNEALPPVLQLLYEIMQSLPWELSATAGFNY